MSSDSNHRYWTMGTFFKYPVFLIILHCPCLQSLNNLLETLVRTGDRSDQNTGIFEFFPNIKAGSFNIQRLQGWCYHSVEIIVKILRVLILVWQNFIHICVDRCRHLFNMCLCLLLCTGGCGLCRYKLLSCNHTWATTESFKLSDCHQDVQNSQKRSWTLPSRIWIYPDFLPKCRPS